jgi:uncharacterized protein YndB with AHSA1/START domain
MNPELTRLVTAPDAAARTVVIERTFDARPSLLFKAHSRPECLMRWFGPPGYPLTLCEVDFRIGGRFRFAMTGPDGTQNPPFGGEYLDIVVDRAISYSNGFLVDGADPPPTQQMHVTNTFTAVGDRAHLVMTTVFGSQAMHDEHTGLGFRIGVNAGLDQLTAVIAGMGTR